MPREDQQTQPKGTIILRETALKAIVYTEILNVRGQGHLIAISAKDPDDLAQNEGIRITIDGAVLGTLQGDIPNTWEHCGLIRSIMENVWKAKAATDYLTTTTGLRFRDQLAIEYVRAAAGTTGLSLTILYDITRTGYHTAV